MSWWGIRKKQKNERKAVRGESKDFESQLPGVYRPSSNSSLEGKNDNGHQTPSPTSIDLNINQSQPPRGLSSSPIHDGSDRRSSVRSTRELFETLSSKSMSPDRSMKGTSSNSPEKGSLSSRYSSTFNTPSHDPLRGSRRNRQSGMSLASHNSLNMSITSGGGNFTPQIFVENSSFEMKLEVGKEKEFPDVKLKLPPLQTSRVRHRLITSTKNPVVGGFGFNLRKAFQPHPEDPEKPLLVHLVEPRPNYLGPLMTGDRILVVNGENVENAPHERVVELIKSSGEIVEMKVASVPELMELNERGVFDDTGVVDTGTRTGSMLRKSARQGVGTLRKTAVERRATTFQAKTESQVDAEKEMLKQEKVWVVHRHGFSLGVIDTAPKSSSSLSSHINIIRSHGKRIRLIDSDDHVELEEEDLEKANPSSLDRVEDLVELVYINESSVLHVLRQRYGSSLIHTFVGRHLIVINPLRPLSLYSDRVKEMFRGCRREDMPPHIFAAGQQAYHRMLQSNTDQSLILMGLSGSGKTFNARYLLQYLATIGQIENGPVTCPKMDAVQLLLHTFTSAATFLNPQATRCSCLYSLEFDSSGSLTAASVRTFLLEKTRVALHPEGEQSFNILYQLIAGADEALRKELLLDAYPGTDESNHYIEPHKEPQQIESAACVWDLIQNCLSLLNVSADEALGLWSLLAAIYHLGFAGVKQGTGRSTDRFVNPAAAQRAASILGIHHEELAKDIFNPPRGTASSRFSTLFSSTMSPSPTISDTSSINLSIGSFNISPGTARANRSFSLDAFVMGLYEYALNALVLLINRSLHPSSQLSKGKYFVHVLDTPGFQHRELAGCTDGTSFDDFCMNYTRERLQMLFHDSSFTMEQDRYIQDDIDWTFPEIVMSPLSIIDVIDKHIPQKRGQGILQNLNDLSDKPDRPGILWILEEESTFPGSNDVTFLERIQLVHGEPDVFGDTTVKVNMEKGHFTILHCQRSLPVNYDIAGWRQRAREHPSTRVVGQVLAESKKKAVICLFQGRGVASLSSSNTSASSLDTTTAMRVGRSLSFSNPTAGIKKSSICLRTKFQLDFLIDIMRKTEQWYIHCLLSQPPHNLPGAILPPDTTELKDDALYGHIDVPLVRAQLRRGDLIPAARMFKQGYPDHVLYPAFRRRYVSLLQPDEKSSLPENDKDAAEFILSGLELDRSAYRLGLSQVFFRAGNLSILERQVEDMTHSMMVKLQAHLRGWLGRHMREKLELQHSAAHVIQRNVTQANIINSWAWWKMFQKIKPLLQVWKAEKEVKEKDSEIGTLKTKLKTIETERDDLKDSELRLNEKLAELSAQLQEAQATAQHASDLLEQDEMDKRELFEQNQDITISEQELIKQNEQLQWQLAELTILSNIKKSEGDIGTGDGKGDESEAMLEKYWETRRELEILRQRISTERDDELERLQHSKRSLEKRLADSEAEVDDLRRNLTQVRKKASKFSSELNDLQLLLESQQARNEELEKKQRKFDSDINSANDSTRKEHLENEQFQREIKILEADNTDLEQRYKKIQESYQQLESEKSEMEAEFIKRAGSSDAESEIASLKRMKKDMESKVEELEDEIDELNIKMDTLQQSKTRLELSQQSLRVQHQKELDGREEDLEQLKATMTKKLKSMEQQLEEEHESKQQAIRAKREIEREFNEAQARMSSDPEVERKLKKQVKKLRTLLKDAQDELEHERETKNNPAVLRSLRSQLEDYEMREIAASKAQKRLQSDLDEMQAQFDDLSRFKLEVDSHVSELQREKSDLESRLEEEQDEVEQLVTKQRHTISQLGIIQHQLTEANFKTEELEEEKMSMDTKLTKLQQRVTELETDDTKQEREASELKVRELEQKLDLEKSTIKRQEALVSRLRTQLDRLQNDKAEDTASKSNEAMKRLQKQMRDLREELQESERKEQEQSRKRRIAETQISEIEVQLQTATADLKYAQKRIESLQVALTAEQYEEEDDDEEDSSPRHHKTTKLKKVHKDTYGDSSDGSYHIAGSSSDEDLIRIEARKKQREKERFDMEDDLEDIEKKYTRKKSVEEDRPRKKTNWSDEDDKELMKGSDGSDGVTPKKKYAWRELLSDDDDSNGPAVTRPVRKNNDEVKKGRKKYGSDDDLSSTVGVISKTIGRSDQKGSDDSDGVTSKKKYAWRELLSDDDDSNGPAVTRPVRKSVDEVKKGRRKYGSDDDLSSTGEDMSKTTGRYDQKGSDSSDGVTPKKKYDWRKLLSDDDDSIGSAVTRPVRKNNDEEKKGRKKYGSDDDLSSTGEDMSKTTGRSDQKTRPSWKSKYDTSDDSNEDKPITKTLSKTKIDYSSDENYKPRRTSKKYLDHSDSDGVRNKKKVDSVGRVKKSWEISSSEDDAYIPRSKKSSRKSPIVLSDDDDLPILKHAPKRSEVSPTPKKTEQSSPAKKENVKFDLKDEIDNDSFKSSRKRRERRRSRLSNTGTSPEDSPKRSSIK